MPSKKQILITLIIAVVGGAIVKAIAGKFAPALAAKL